MSLFSAGGAAEAGAATGNSLYPRLINTSAYADGNTTSATPTIGGSPQAGDLILAFVYQTNGGDGVFPAAPSGEGWTSITTVEETGGNNIEIAIFYKYWGVSGNTDDTTPTFTRGGAGAASVGAVVQTWRDVRQASPISGSNTAHASSGTTEVGAEVNNQSPEWCSAVIFWAGLTAAGNISGISGTNFTTAASGSSYATTAGPDRACGISTNQKITTTGNVGASGVTATYTVGVTATATVTVVLRGP